MADKVLKTRIQNKFATADAWSTSTLKLLPGELAIMPISAATPGDAIDGIDTTTLGYMIKVGNGDTFANSKGLVALAADVHSWAKAATFNEGTYGTGAVDGNLPKTHAAIKALQDAIGSSGSVSEMIKAAIEALDVEDAAVTGQFVTAVAEADGKITVTRRALAKADILDAVSSLARTDITAIDNAIKGVETRASDIEATLIGYGKDSTVKTVKADVDAVRQLATTAGTNATDAQDRVGVVENVVKGFSGENAIQTAVEAAQTAADNAQADVDALAAKDPANKILESLTTNEIAYYDSIVTCIDDLNNGQPAASADEKSDRSECFIYLKNGTLVIVLLKDIFPLERLYIKVPVEFVFAGHRIIVASSNVTAGLTCNGSYTYINGTMGGGVYVENPKTSSWCICAGPSVTKFIVDGGEYTIKGNDQNTGSAKAIETYNSDCITEIRNARIDISGVGNIVLGCRFVDKATVKDSDIKIHTTSSTSARGILAQNDIHIENCDINTVATVGTSTGVSVEKGRATVVACNIEVDSSNNAVDDTGTYGYALNVYPEVESCSISYGTYTGTHSAVGMMSNDFRAFGATFYSCAHGGIYFSGQKAYVKDCIIGCRAYNGRFDFSSMENDLLGDFYIGSNSDCTVYMDNCVLTGEGNHCGVLRGTDGEKRNILYISRTAIPDGKQFRIDSGNYMVAGEGSDVDKAQVTLPSALSTTAYIYDYEHMCANEVSESMKEALDAMADGQAKTNKEVTEAVNDLSVRVSNLESLSLTYVEDTAISYEKLVPADVGKYALVKRVGGILKKSNNLLNVADATAIAYEKVTIDGDVIKIAPASSLYGIQFLNASEIFEVGKTYYFTASPSQFQTGTGFRFSYTDKSYSKVIRRGVLTVEKEISTLNYYIKWGDGFDTETTISNIQAVEGDEPCWEYRRSKGYGY